MADSRVGDVLQAQGKLEKAQAAFAEYLAISRRLAEQDPSNPGWQRVLATAHGVTHRSNHGKSGAFDFTINAGDRKRGTLAM